MAVTDRAPSEEDLDLRAALAEGHIRLRGLLAGLTEDAARAPSALPGWTRGHLLSHVEGVARALARQARYALRGRTVEVYDGGRAARDAAIEAGHGRGAAELAAAVGDALDEAEASWDAVGPGDWRRPVAYRDGTVRTAGLAWWRELQIHTADALLGTGPDSWPPHLCLHLVDFLAVRVPAGTELRLAAVDADRSWTLGEGEPVAVEGRLTDLAAWLAGRAPQRPLTGGPLPELGNWP
ncbi:maleylpyruvate isomerase family mycothiol-dependent enzyme [Actinacidiphila paucisporea]|uniref:maleylpyruvate isomerase family mycothiol-dependent enzyme n=1 Tax=Actinacidiphila paucisporea TaxID=310782 RepID=UPI001F452DDE|nr:maleylpyruvate isomerase family mycothiol-dependent enzyme [Actinacidiphila paucisporea]